MRRRLALVSLAVASLVVLAFVIALSTVLRNQAYNQALLEGQRDAQTIAAVLAASAEPVAQTGEVEVTKDLGEFVIDTFRNRSAISVIFQDGTVIGTPVEIGPAIERARGGEAFSIAAEGGIAVLVPVLSTDAPIQDTTVVVRKFVSDEELTKGVAEAWLMIGALGIFLIVVAVVAADRLGRSIVRPVSRLADAARSLGDGDLDARVTLDGPEEVADVGEAFNFLAGQLEALLAAERESVADLSHRLRTPLTALRLQAETMAETDESASLLADVDRMEQAVNRMITEARTPSSAANSIDAVSDLGGVLRHRATFWKILADEQGRPAGVHTTGGRLPVELPPDELGAVIDTLLANIFSYTEPGVGYQLSAAPTGDGQIVLTVEDDGPGFADPSVLERGASGGGSTGLGLDIARRAAERTGGVMEIGNRPSGGARVSVRFGVAQQPGEAESLGGPRPSGTRARPNRPLRSEHTPESSPGETART
jgi:signal transduction histidine kinase